MSNQFNIKIKYNDIVTKGFLVISLLGLFISMYIHFSEYYNYGSMKFEGYSFLIQFTAIITFGYLILLYQKNELKKTRDINKLIFEKTSFISVLINKFLFSYLLLIFVIKIIGSDFLMSLNIVFPNAIKNPTIVFYFSIFWIYFFFIASCGLYSEIKRQEEFSSSSRIDGKNQNDL